MSFISDATHIKPRIHQQHNYRRERKELEEKTLTTKVHTPILWL